MYRAVGVHATHTTLFAIAYYVTGANCYKLEPLASWYVVWCNKECGYGYE